MPWFRGTIPVVASALAALLAITAVSWAHFVDHDVHDMRWKLRPGEVLRYRMVMTMGSRVSQTHQVMLTRYEVEGAASDGTMDVTSWVDQVAIRNGDSEGPVVWDSGSGASPPKDYAVQMSAAWVGVPVRYKVDVQGRILSSEGMELVQKRAKELLGGGVAGPFMDPITEVAFSATGGTLQGASLPPTPVRKGAVWAREGGAGTKTFGATRYVCEYSLSSVKDGIATITLLQTRDLEQTPGEIPKALKIQTPPDPNAQHGSEEVTNFSISEGVMVSQVNRAWSQSTTTKGEIFRFETSSETKYLDRRGKQ
jgi:hypothetical protein